jgi:hypothetical protein
MEYPFALLLGGLHLVASSESVAHPHRPWELTEIIGSVLRHRGIAAKQRTFGIMDIDFEKALREVMQKSQELTRQSEELAAKTEALLAQFRERKKQEGESGRKKLGSS